MPVSGWSASSAHGTATSAADAAAQLGDGGVERRPGRVGHRVGDRPVQPGRVGAELLVGPVADRDHQRRPSAELVEAFRVGSGEVETGPAAGGDGARVDAVGRVGAGAVRALVGELGPQGRGELGSGRVVGAHEQRPLSGSAPARRERAEGVAVEVDVAAAAVAAGSAAADQADVLEHVEVVGEQVRRDGDEALQLDRGAVGGGELVDDRQPHGIAQRRVAGAAEITMLVGVHPTSISLDRH